MRSFQVSLLLSITCIGAMISCKETSTTEPPDAVNLIANGSFESNEAPSLIGWKFGNSQLARSVNEAPPGGGSWSLELTADWAPTMGYAYVLVPELKTGDIVKLTAYVRAFGSSGGGVVRIGTQNGAAKSASTSDTVWTHLSITDTVNLAPGDTVMVVLSSFHTELLPLKGLFDLVVLEKISGR